MFVFTPAIDEFFPRQRGNAVYGAAFLGFLICCLTMFICCVRGQEAYEMRSGWGRRLLTLVVLGVFFCFAQWRQGPAYWLVAVLTGFGVLVSGIAGYFLGFLITPALEEVSALWQEIRKMGTVLGSFVVGYLFLILMFSCLYAGIWAFDHSQFSGLPAIALPESKPRLFDFAYFSVVTAATLGYGDVVPAKPLARFAAGVEVLLGVGWTIVVFAAVVSRLQEREKKDRDPL